MAQTAAKPTSAAAGPATAAHHRAPRSRPAAAATTAQAPVATYVDPVTVVQEFYSDLNRRNFEAAYSIGGYNTFGGNDYQRWVAGYAAASGWAEGWRRATEASLGEGAHAGMDQV